MEMGRVPRPIAALGGIEFYFGSTSTLVKGQIQGVVAGTREVKRLQSVAGPAWIRVRHREASDRQLKTIITVHAEGPVSRGRNGDGCGRVDGIVVLIGPNRQSGERSVASIMCAVAGIEVIDHRRVFLVDGGLLAGVG